jgi:hypothetical protein
MANKTLLNAVNDLLRRAGIIAGDSAVLTTLTDSARQVDIDQAVQIINEGIEELYSSIGTGLPNQQTSATITLATGTRAYILATGLVRLHWPLIDKTNSQFIDEYGPGYDELLELDPEQDDTGLPQYGVIRPTDSYLFLDLAPTSADNGKIYTYQYDKDISVSSASDTVPFNDTIYRAMIPAWFQLWKRERRNEFDKDLFKMSIGRASRLLPQTAPRTNYCPR